VKNAVNFIGNFEDTLAKEAKRLECDGVICGHIHHAAIREMHGVTYVNTGDFVESCTGVLEHMDGRLEIVQWTRKGGQLPVQVPALPAPGERVDEAAPTIPAAA
jgi:UDP-2,3-diacylglucosamine pyrophosphatase LpxH